MRIFCLTRGPTRSWRNGDAQSCQLGNIADPFSDFFSLQKSAQVLFSPWESLVLPHEPKVLLSQCAHTHTHTSLSLSLCVCSVSVQRAAEKCSALIQLNLVWAIYLNSSVKPVPWLAVNVCHLFTNGAAFNTRSRRSLASYAISLSLAQMNCLR